MKIFIGGQNMETIFPIQTPEETEARKDRFSRRLAEVIVDEACELQVERNLATLRDAVDLLMGGAR